jgi:hypothetical protein
MPLTALPAYGSFEIPGRPTGTGGTPFTALVVPFQGTSPLLAPGSPFLTGGAAKGFAHVTKVIYTTPADPHLIAIMRPLNRVRFSAAALAGQQVVTLAPFNYTPGATQSGDPGIFSTNYGYGAIPNGTSSVADHGIASGDYCAYQNADGTWTVDTAASTYTAGTGATGTVTMSTNLKTGGVVAGGLFYYFGLVTNTDPATGQLPPQTNIAASQTRDASWADPVLGVAHALHAGDPLLFYSNNATAAGFLEALMGYWGKY